MKISVYNAPKHMSKKKLKKAIETYGQALLGRLYNKVELHVRFKALDDPDGDAECFPAAEDDARADRPRLFGINVDPRCAKNQHHLLEMIAHEMVHLKQFAKGELFQYTIKRGARWFNTYFNVSISYADKEYLHLPWEVEAYGMQKALAHIYVTDYNYEYDDGKYLSV